MRLFIAITLDPAIQEALSTFSGTLRSKTDNSVRWVKPANIHLTLKFLGEVDQGNLAPLKREIQKIASQFTPFDLTIQGCGVFPEWRQPRVVWAGVQAPQTLSQMVGAIENGLRSLGFPAEERPFNPHLTIGRVNEWMTQSQRKALQEGMEAALNKRFGSVRADHLTLYRSDLRPDGPVYSELFRANFSLAEG